MLSISSVLIGLVVGYIVAIPMGKIDFSSLSQAPLLSVPVPFKLGFAFHIDAIIAMIFVYGFNCRNYRRYNSNNKLWA